MDCDAGHRPSWTLPASWPSLSSVSQGPRMLQSRPRPPSLAANSLRLACGSPAPRSLPWQNRDMFSTPEVDDGSENHEGNFSPQHLGQARVLPICNTESSCRHPTVQMKSEVHSEDLQSHAAGLEPMTLVPRSHLPYERLEAQSFLNPDPGRTVKTPSHCSTPQPYRRLHHRKAFRVCDSSQVGLKDRGTQRPSFQRSGFL